VRPPWLREDVVLFSVREQLWVGGLWCCAGDESELEVWVGRGHCSAEGGVHGDEGCSGIIIFYWLIRYE